MTTYDTTSLAALSSHLGVRWPHIFDARQEARAQREKIEAAVSGLVPTDASIVVFGSLARDETTSGSDLDWTLLIDGQAHASHLDARLEIDARLSDIGLEPPGREGTFGGLTFSHDLIHFIGGEADTNANITRRLLLLLESKALGPSEAYSRVKAQVVKRYVDEDLGLRVGTTYGVPRFLLNDIVRFWRTMTVDFAYKRRARRQKGWALRTVKLRLARKLTFVSGLIACYECAGVDLAAEPTPATKMLALGKRLDEVLSQAPLEILAAELLKHRDRPDIMQAAEKILRTYDSYLAMLDDPTQRTALDDLAPEESHSDATYEAARELGHEFQSGLDKIFLEQNSTQLYVLTRKYGVF